MPITPPGCRRALVLGGGNALGAYHLGACEALLDGLAPDRILGTSIGAVTGAILLGNPPETRLRALRAFWRQAARPGALPGFSWDEARARESVYAGLGALLGGRPGLFRGGLPGLWPQLLPGGASRGLNDHAPLARTLARLVDFDRLNEAETTLEVVALDVETGEEVWFSNRSGRIGPEHLLAATAFMPLFPPVDLGGRLLCDAGLVANVPLDRAFGAPGHPAAEPGEPLLCVAIDLFSTRHDRPQGLNGTMARAQDLAFAGQTERAARAIARERALLRRADPDSPPAVLGRLAFRAPGHQRALKTLDFTRASIDERIACGRADAALLLARLDEIAWDSPFAEVIVETRATAQDSAPAAEMRHRHAGL